MDIPVGPNNKIEPGPVDQGQPTHFETGRNWGVLVVKVPKDFGKKTITWTITANGEPVTHNVGGAELRIDVPLPPKPNTPAPMPMPVAAAAQIVLPGLDPHPLQKFFEDQTAAGGGALVGILGMFTGGALLKGAVGALGIMPYISASIIFQLMTAVVPSLSRLQQEGDVGRQKLTQYTRYATVFICVVQGALTIMALENPGKLVQGYDVATYGPIVMSGGWGFLVTSVIFMTGGTMLLSIALSINSFARASSNSGLLGGLVTRMSSIGSTMPRPKKWDQ